MRRNIPSVEDDTAEREMTFGMAAMGLINELTENQFRAPQARTASSTASSTHVISFTYLFNCGHANSFLLPTVRQFLIDIRLCSPPQNGRKGRHSETSEGSEGCATLLTI